MALTKAHYRMIEGSAANVKDFGAAGDATYTASQFLIELYGYA